MTHDVLVLGAGIAGLACARELQARGARALLLDRADKPGGRCATRELGGVRADYGPVFLHGDDTSFLAALDAIVPDGRIEGWPRAVKGTGTPCQPHALSGREPRFALRAGVNDLPARMARGLSVELGAQIAGVAASVGGYTVSDVRGRVWSGRDLVLAMALEQSGAFLGALGPSRERDTALALLEMFSSVACLSLVAFWESSPRLEWDLAHPEDSGVVHLVSNETSKRPDTRGLCLVIQARPRWSREHLGQPPDEWSRLLLGETARLLGGWAATPDRIHPHRWRYARVEGANEMVRGLVLPGAAGRIALVGDLFAPGGGIQAAWLSGTRTARTLCTGSDGSTMA